MKLGGLFSRQGLDTFQTVRGPDGIVGKLPLPCAHAGSPAEPAAFQFCPGVSVRLAVKEHLQAVVLPVHLHMAAVKLPAGKGLLRPFGKFFDTGFDTADLRIVVGELIAFKGLRGAPPACRHVGFQPLDLVGRQQGAAVQRPVFSVVGVDFLHNELGAFQRVQLFLELFHRRRVVGADTAHAGAAYLIQQPLNVPPFLHVAVPCPVLLFFLPDREIGRPRNHYGGHSCVNGKALVHVLGQFPGVGVQQMVNLFMVHGVNPCFLVFRHSGGLIDHRPVLCRCAPFPIVGKAVHFLCPPGGCFIDGIILNRFTPPCASGQHGPKSYRSSWESPALSFLGAGGAS